MSWKTFSTSNKGPLNTTRHAGSKDHRFPYDKGIAGYVFMTGMPIATSNVREDKRFNQDFAKSTGYVPTSILATPLISADDRIIGVMEVLDKLDGNSFDMHDMELIGVFAQQAAMATTSPNRWMRYTKPWCAG